MRMTDNPYESDELPRDRFGRPLIYVPERGRLVAYTRATTYAGSVEDTYKLGQWMQRMVALGLAYRPDLMVSVAAFHDDKDELNKICDTAIEAAKGRAAAGVGTALHALTDKLDRGEELGPIPAEYMADLQAFERATKPLRVLSIERFVVLDELKVGGTFDRLYEFEGRWYIGDTKSGSIEWGAGKIAMQLALYSRSVPYDYRTRQRSTFGGDVDQDRGIVVHMPAGSGEAELKWVDIAAGWRAVELATAVRKWRSRKGLITPLQTAEGVVRDVFPETVPLTLMERVKAATSRAELVALYLERDEEWTDDHTRAAKVKSNKLHQATLRRARVMGRKEETSPIGEPHKTKGRAST
jgi:hypothetical protein